MVVVRPMATPLCQINGVVSKGMNRVDSAKWLPLLLILAVLILFWPVLLNPSLIVHPTFSPFSDTMVIHWPKARLMAESRPAGAGLPLWTPLILSGMPLAANQLAMLFYPPAWLFLILPIEPVFNLLHIFHLLLGGFGMYFLLRKGHALSPAAALLGALTFALNGKWLAHIAGGHVSMVGAIAWMPWILFGLMMLLHPPPNTRPGYKPDSPFKWTLLMAVALAMQIATHTLIVIYSIYLIAAATTWHFLRLLKQEGLSGIKTEIKRLLAPMLLIPILAGLLAAVQLLPLLELVDFSNRSLNLTQAQLYSVSVTQLFVGLLLPSAQGGHELVIYLGLIPLLLVPVGLTRRNGWTWFYGALFIFTLLFALGPATPIHSLFYYAAPGFRWVRTPARIFFVGMPAAAALTGFGVEQLFAGRWSATSKQWLTRLALAGGTLALLFGVGLLFIFGQSGRAVIALAFFVPAALLIIVLGVNRAMPTRPAIILLGLMLVADLAWFDTSMMKFVPPEEALSPGRAAARYLAEKPGHFRTYSPSYSLPMQTAAAHNLHLADGVEPVHLADYDEFMARAGGYSDASFSVTIPNFGNEPPDTALKDTRPNLKLLGLLNVHYLAAAFPMGWPGLSLETTINGTHIYVNEHALPRAWVSYRSIPAQADWPAQLESLPDLANVVTVPPGSPLLESNRAAGQATIIGYSANVITLDTNIEEPGWLVLSEIWYPGWQAEVNGSPVTVEKVNGILRGVYLPQSGPYQVTFAYRPNSVRWGGWLSGLTIVLVVVGGGIMWRNSRSKE